MGKMKHRLRGLGIAIALTLVAASCAIGVTLPASDITDHGARLTGEVRNTITGPTEYWFEYGPTTVYGASTPHRSLDVSDTTIGYPVSEDVIGLAVGTLHHYRVCALATDGKGVCGADRTFTTTGDRDSVTGTATVFSITHLGYAIGGSFSASSDPDGGHPAGTASTSPGVFYFRFTDSGPVTCLHVEGNRATIGFVSDPARFGLPSEILPVFVLAYVEDNGPTGDRFGMSTRPSPIACPAPTAADFADFSVPGFDPIPPVVTSGDFVVHDAPTG